jgi:hypothetical protein
MLKFHFKKKKNNIHVYTTKHYVVVRQDDTLKRMLDLKLQAWVTKNQHHFG